MSVGDYVKKLHHLLYVGAALSVSGIAATPAIPQDGAGMFARDRNVSVTERPRPAYTSGGIQQGAFVIQPSLTMRLESTDNVYATETNELSDEFVTLIPAVSIGSTWSRHQLGVNASVSRYQYSDANTENRTDYAVGINGRVDVLRSSFVNGGVDFRSSHEPRGSAAAVGLAARPIAFDQASAFIGASREFSRVLVAGQISIDEFDYDDVDLIGGGVGDQDFRDRTDVSIEGRADYAYSPDTSFFVRIINENQSYDSAIGGVVRDQDTLTFEGGVSFDISDLITGEVGIGMFSTDFDDATRGSKDSLSFSGDAEWYVTPLTTVSVNASRRSSASGIAAAASSTNTSVGAAVDHELLRNLILSSSISYTENSFEGLDRADDTFRFNLGGTYLVNRNVGVTATYSRSSRDSSGAAAQAGYDDNRFMISLVWQR